MTEVTAQCQYRTQNLGRLAIPSTPAQFDDQRRLFLVNLGALPSLGDNDIVERRVPFTEARKADFDDHPAPSVPGESDEVVIRAIREIVPYHVVWPTLRVEFPIADQGTCRRAQVLFPGRPDIPALI